MDTQVLRQIKKLVIISLFSDDDLMDKFVLKGGNALDIVYELTNRPSLDVDISIENDFDPDQLPEIKEKISTALKRTFSDNEYTVFDIKFVEKPKVVSSDMKDFWGGYSIKFKLINSNTYLNLCNNTRTLRTCSIALGKGERKEFEIEISKYEYCRNKVNTQIDGFTVYVYTPEMIICEKLRSICQQMPEYLSIIKSNTGSPRTQDFYDIYVLMDKFKIDLLARENAELLLNMFMAKKVPIRLIGNIYKYREYHSSRYEVLKSTAGIKLNEFSFYFDYVLDICMKLEPIWKV